MNTLYYINKAVGVLFAAGLVAFGGYHAYCWRQRMGEEAKQRMEKRLVEIGEQSVSDFKFSTTSPFTSQINPDYWSNFQGSTIVPAQTLSPPGQE